MFYFEREIMSMLFDVSTHAATSMIGTETRAANDQDHAIERGFQVDERHRTNRGPMNKDAPKS